MIDVDVEVKGLIELQRKTMQMVRDLHGDPILDAMKDSTLLVTRYAAQNAPVDTGKLQASILPEIRVEPLNIIGVVGSNVLYAPYVEEGTRPHWPPISALEVWSRRHGMVAFLVARAISRRGTRKVLYLERAFRKAENYIVNRFDRSVSLIVEKHT